MPRPDEPVPFNHVLWDAVREGCIVSEDLSPSLRLRESLSATLPVPVRARARGQPLQPLPLPLQPSPGDWRAESARLRASLPYGRQASPTVHPPSGSGHGHGHSRSDDQENVALNIMRAELGAVEKAAAAERCAAARRERALLKVVSGLCEYQSEFSALTRFG